MSQRNPVPHCQHPRCGLNCGPQRYVHLESLKVTLFGMRVFVDVIKVRIVRYNHSGLGLLKPMMSLYKREERTMQRHREAAVWSWGQSWGTEPRSREHPCHQQRPEARTAAWKDFPAESPQGTELAGTRFWTSGLLNRKRVQFLLF